MTMPDLKFLLSQSINPAIVLNSDLMVVGKNNDAKQMSFAIGQGFLDGLNLTDEKVAMIQNCFTSTLKRRFSLTLKEGFDTEAIGWRLAGPYSKDKLVMIQFVDLVQARANFLTSTQKVQNQRKTLALSSKNKTLEARIAERTSQLLNLNANLETTVAERTVELTKTNEETQELTYIVTHDLKVPVTNLTHLTQILASDTDNFNEDQIDILELMTVSCDQASEKLNSLLSVAKARSADLADAQTIDLERIAKAACDALTSEIDTRDAKITCDFTSAPVITYLPDESLSLFENLLGNAIKYTPKDRTPNITVRSWKIPNFICLSIRDNGSGLNLPRDEDKVFGLFKRAHIDPPGSGIALYTIRKILERYGGTVSLDSVLGKWTEFTFKFPETSPH